MDVRKKIQEAKLAEKLIDKKYIIYPFGNIGRQVKEILNNEYELQEYAIADSFAGKSDSNVRSLSEFDNKISDELIVVLACDSLRYYSEIRDVVRAKFKPENVIDLTGIVNVDIDPRIESLRLCANIINENGIKGAVAEAGVFEGDFAKNINLFFPNRTLYLFDTFEGFENKMLEQNVDECWEKWMKNNYGFTSSGGESVLRKMPFPDKCVIKKGFFPQTAEHLQETFCFVNIDMDIYQSTKDGLEYFWPRMEKRGVVFIHDYFSWNCPGVKKAVDEFCGINDIGFACLPEYNGTVVLVK